MGQGELPPLGFTERKNINFGVFSCIKDIKISLPGIFYKELHAL